MLKRYALFLLLPFVFSGFAADCAQANINADFRLFADSAHKLSRLVETGLKPNSYLDRLSKRNVLHNDADLRPVYRFWSLYLTFSDRLNHLAKKYEVPLFRQGSVSINADFEKYLIGIAAKLTHLFSTAELMRFVEKRSKLQTLLNEPNPEFGLKKDSLRHELNRAIAIDDLARLYRFRLSHFEKMQEFYRGKSAVKPECDNEQLLLRSISTHKPLLDHLLRNVASKPAWKILGRTIIDKTSELILPLQKDLFSWVGDTRIKNRETRLISNRQIKEFEKQLQPGDIILERQDWYLSNLFLPGFWPHGIIYLGDGKDLNNFFKTDPEVDRWLKNQGCKNFVDLLQQRFPQTSKAFLHRNHDGHRNVVIEAISEGVVFNSIEHSCRADYLAALRPQLSKLNIARSIIQAFFYYGREYDFSFSFESEQTLVCTELVSKAFVRGDGTGLKLPYNLQFGGKYGVTADDIARLFADEHGKPGAQLEFVAFLLGQPQNGSAVFSDVATFKLSPGWRGGLTLYSGM